METMQLDWKLILLEGIVFVILGIVALLNPFIMALSLDILLGAVLIVAGIVQGFRALKDLKAHRSVPLLIGAAFALIAGVLLFAYPMTGVLTLTLLLTAFFLVDGTSRIIGSFQYRPLKGWFWLLISGLISVALGLLIIFQLPMSAVWVIGIYMGIYLLLVGISLITFAFFGKNKHGGHTV